MTYTKKFAVEYWNSEPLTNDDCFIGKDFDTREEAEKFYNEMLNSDAWDIPGKPGYFGKFTAKQFISFSEFHEKSEQWRMLKFETPHEPIRRQQIAHAKDQIKAAANHAAENPDLFDFLLERLLIEFHKKEYAALSAADQKNILTSDLIYKAKITIENELYLQTLVLIGES